MPTARNLAEIADAEKTTLRSRFCLRDRGSAVNNIVRKTHASPGCAWALLHEAVGVDIDLNANPRTDGRVAQPGAQDRLNIRLATAFYEKSAAMASA